MPQCQSTPALGRHDLPDRALYAPREVERILSISQAQVYRLIGAGRLDARKIGRATYITRSSIDKFLAELPPAQVPRYDDAAAFRRLRMHNSNQIYLKFPDQPIR